MDVPMTGVAAGGGAAFVVAGATGLLIIRYVPFKKKADLLVVYNRQTYCYYVWINDIHHDHGLEQGIGHLWISS